MAIDCAWSHVNGLGLKTSFNEMMFSSNVPTKTFQKLLELAEKQEKEKKPIELQDPAKAHAPSSFAEKENEKRPEQSDDAQTKPIFGTFGKNLTEKVTTENGAGDKTEVEEKKEDKPVS